MAGRGQGRREGGGEGGGRRGGGCSRATGTGLFFFSKEEGRDEGACQILFEKLDGARKEEGVVRGFCALS